MKNDVNFDQIISSFDTSLENIFKFQDSIPQFSPVGDILSAPVLLLAGAIIIFLGIAGEAFFKKTGIPDIAFLMIFGVIIGPIFGIIPTSTVIEIVPYFAAIALILIMFDGGLNLDYFFNYVITFFLLIVLYCFFGLFYIPSLAK